MQRALVAGVLMGATLSLLGVFVVLRRSAFFGDAVAHFAFAGIALGFLFAMNPIVAAVFVSLFLALGMGYLQNHAPTQSLDTIIGIFFSGAQLLASLLSGFLKDTVLTFFNSSLAISLPFPFRM